MSVWAQATVAANSAVVAPTASTMSFATGANSYSGDIRATRNTPAVTIVAAWISADTGVGPSIASSSQVWSGNCADLPHAPRSSNNPIAVSVPRCAPAAELRTSAYDVLPKVANISMIAMDRPTSPTRLTMNAFFAAVAAVGLCVQYPISRYDARPTPSQPTYKDR